MILMEMKRESWDGDGKVKRKNSRLDIWSIGMTRSGWDLSELCGTTWELESWWWRERKEGSAGEVNIERKCTSNREYLRFSYIYLPNSSRLIPTQWMWCIIPGFFSQSPVRSVHQSFIQFSLYRLTHHASLKIVPFSLFPCTGNPNQRRNRLVRLTG